MPGCAWLDLAGAAVEPGIELFRPQQHGHAVVHLGDELVWFGDDHGGEADRFARPLVAPGAPSAGVKYQGCRGFFGPSAHRSVQPRKQVTGALAAPASEVSFIQIVKPLMR
jgi:hypothetical protein